VRPVLHLDPVFRPAGAIAPVAAFRDQALEAHPAGRAKQLRADLAGLERGDEHPVRAAAQQAREVCLAHGKRQLAQILAPKREDVEGVELHLGIVLARVAVMNACSAGEISASVSMARCATAPATSEVASRLHPSLGLNATIRTG
jgi:hypothetical protein